MEEFVSRHSQNNQPFINRDLLRAEFGLSHADAKAVKSLLAKRFSSEDLEQYA
jgi:predicted transcriptional regulator